MEKVRPWCGQPSDRGRLRNRTELKRWTLFCQQNQNTSKNHMVIAEPLFTVKLIDCVHRTGPMKEHSILRYVTITLDVYHQVCYGVDRCV